MLKLQCLAADEEDGDKSLKVFKVFKVESRKVSLQLAVWDSDEGGEPIPQPPAGGSGRQSR